MRDTKVCEGRGQGSLMSHYPGAGKGIPGSCLCTGKGPAVGSSGVGGTMRRVFGG